MDNEVRITLITTGFTAKLAQLDSAAQEDELTSLLKGLKTEEELDIPSFLRRPLYGHRKHSTTATPKEAGVEPVKQHHYQ